MRPSSSIGSRLSCNLEAKMHPGMVCIELNHDNLRILEMTALDSISPSGALYLCKNVDYCASRHLCTKSKGPMNQEGALLKGGDIAVEA